MDKHLQEFESLFVLVVPVGPSSNLHFLFFRVDINKDRSVSAKEMQRWIMEKTEEHFQEAVRENKLSFRAVDPDGDGKWVVIYSYNNYNYVYMFLKDGKCYIGFL